MKRLSATASVLAASIAQNAYAEGDRLVLRAEDTPGVTRLEIEIGAAPFSLQSPEDGVIDFVTPHNYQSVNISQLAADGLASRLANARFVPDEAASRLRMVLNCDCNFDFSVSKGVLAIRILDRPSTVRESTSEADENQKRAPKASREASSVTRPAPDRAPAPRSRPNPGAEKQVVSAGDAQSSVELGSADTALALDDDASEEVLLARDHLMQQLSRAAEQGLIQFVSDEAAAQAPEPEDIVSTPLATESPETEFALEPEPDEPAPPPENEAEPTELAEIPDTPSAPVEIPVRARTAIDRDFSPDRRETRVVTAYCIERQRLELASWAQPAPFLDVVSKLRADLLDEFDQPQPEIATKLARQLAIHGFGAEAAQLTRLYGEAIEDSDLLREIALLIDAGKPEASGVIAKTAPCNPEAALWRVIGGLPDGDVQFDYGPGVSKADMGKQMLDAFARLPVTTRRMVGAQLMNNLINKGDLDLASQLDLILLRNPTLQDEAIDLARARLFGETGRLEEAEELYSNLSQSSRPEAHTALLLLLESRLGRGAGGSRSLSEALGDAAFSARNTPMELPLKVAEVRSRASTEGANEALQVLLTELKRSNGSSKLLQDVGHAALEQITPGEDDVVEYAKAVMAMRPYISEGQTSDPARQHVADILIDAGLPNLALEFLKPAQLRASEKTALAAARAYLATDQIEAALSELNNLQSARANKLRVLALERSGRFEEANRLSAEILQQNDDVQSARALRAGDWAAASLAGDDSRRQLASFMASKTAAEGDRGDASQPELNASTPTGPAKTTLDSVRTVVEGSKSSRSTIEEALKDG